MNLSKKIRLSPKNYSMKPKIIQLKKQKNGLNGLKNSGKITMKID